MTSLDAYAADVRARAAKVSMPSLTVILVTLISLVPFLLGWTINAGWQFLTLLRAGFLKGWDKAEAQMGVDKPDGGS